MGNCTTKLPADNSYTHPLTLNPASNPFAITAATNDNDTTNDPLATDTNSANNMNNNNNNNTNNNNINNTNNSSLETQKEDIVILLATDRRRLLIYGYAHKYNVPIDILDQLVLIWIDESFYWKIRYDELYKLKNETENVVSFTSSIFIYRNIKFQLQITKILKEHNDHGFQLSARLLSKNVIVTTTIALQCDETNCGYHNFVENFTESGWPSSTLKLSDINDDIIELNFICKFDILRIQKPMMLMDDDNDNDDNDNNDNMNIISPYYKDIRMKQKVDILWSLDDDISPSYRTDNDDSSLILFYESPPFEDGSYVLHFIQSSIMERDGFAVMLELFTYPQGVTKMTLKWIVIISYDGKIIKKSATDQFSLSDSCHSKAFSKSDFHFIGESNVFSLSLLTIKVQIEILEIYDEKYNEIIKTNWKNNIRHWPKYNIFNEEQSNIYNEDTSNIMKLENKIKKMDEKLNQLLSIQNNNEISSKFNMKRNENEIKSNFEIKKWLSSNVGLPNYYDLLIKNGFNSLEMIKEINNLNDLKYIGVNCKAHQLKLMNHINKLKAN